MKRIYRITSADKDVVNYVDFDPNLALIYNDKFLGDKTADEDKDFLFGEAGVLYSGGRIKDESFSKVPPLTQVVFLEIPKGKKNLILTFENDKRDAELYLSIKFEKCDNGFKLVPTYKGLEQTNKQEDILKAGELIIYVMMARREEAEREM